MDEREVGLRLKGQNGIMRKKFNTLQNDIEAQKEEIKALFDQKRELYQDISSLEKDILSKASTLYTSIFQSCSRSQKRS